MASMDCWPVRDVDLQRLAGIELQLPETFVDEPDPRIWEPTPAPTPLSRFARALCPASGFLLDSTAPVRGSDGTYLAVRASVAALDSPARLALASWLPVSLA